MANRALSDNTLEKILESCTHPHSNVTTAAKLLSRRGFFASIFSIGRRNPKASNSPQAKPPKPPKHCCCNCIVELWEEERLIIATTVLLFRHLDLPHYLSSVRLQVVIRVQEDRTRPVAELIAISRDDEAAVERLFAGLEACCWLCAVRGLRRELDRRVGAVAAGAGG